jgi:hypothetical protein
MRHAGSRACLKTATSFTSDFADFALGIVGLARISSKFTRQHRLLRRVSEP